MGKVANVVDSAQLAQAEFRKIFGDDAYMYYMAGEEEIAGYLTENPDDFYIFLVPREKPLTSERFVPYELLRTKKYDFVAQPGEFFVFQVIVWAPHSGLMQATTTCSDAVTFVESGNVRADEVKIFWLGIDIPQDVCGVLTKEIVVHTQNMGEKRVSIDIQVEGDVLYDAGESDDEKMARLKWLNSDIGREDTVFSPYVPLQKDGDTISWLGHSITLGANGFPISITSNMYEQSHQLLNAPINMKTHAEEFKGQYEITKESNTRIEWICDGFIGENRAKLRAAIEFDGYLEFSLMTKGSGNYSLCLDCANTDYMVGLGKPGCRTPKRMDWFWDKRAWQDGCWLGNEEGGIRLRLKDSKSKLPLTNCYYHFSEIHLPEAWHNNGHGGISLNEHELKAFSGEIQEDKDLEFGFELQITPFRQLEVETHFKTHAWHPCMHHFELGGPDPIEEVDFEQLKQEGITRINVHHGVGMNPFINYPISNLSLPRLQALVERAHEHNVEVVLYYTTREISIHPAEFWAFRSMGNEILQEGLGEEARPATNGQGPNAWLCNNLRTPYLPAWAETIKNGPACNNIDIALETTPESRRLENFFLEGLRYLLERCPIDGLYFDDTSLSRDCCQRIYRIFEKYTKKTPIIDFHAWSPYHWYPMARDFGRCSVILRDMANLPYFTQLWLGESYDYEHASPDYYLTEISGIPFGIMGQMLQNGGNPWRGILYGMTSRYGWSGDPRNLWAYFEKFGVSGIQMELDVAFPATLPDGIRVTRYTNDANRCCYALASWEKEPVVVNLPADKWRVEYIPDFQEEGQYTLEPGKGLIIQEVQ